MKDENCGKVIIEELGNNEMLSWDFVNMLALVKMKFMTIKLNLLKEIQLNIRRKWDDLQKAHESRNGHQ